MAKRLIPGKTNKDKGKILSHRRPKVDLNVLKGTRYEHLIKCLEAREEENKKKRINLQTLLNRANHSFRHENIKYFALEKDRDEFAKDCRS